jgi:MFS family permease
LQQKSRVRFTLAVLFAVNLLNFYDRSIFGAVAEPIRKQWALSDAQVGWLATAFTLLYAIVGLPMGRLSDTSRRSRLLAVGVAIWSLLTAASGWASNFASMFAARLGVGIGEAVCAPAGNSLIGDLYPAAKRGRALGIFMLGLPIGYFLGSWISGQIAATYGWRMAFYIACLPGLLVAALAARILDPPRGATEGNADSKRRQPRSPYRAVLSIPTLSWIIASGVVYNFDGYAYATFLPAYLIRYHGQTLSQANLAFAIFWGIGGVAGLLSGGWIADHVSRKSRSGRMVTAGIALFLSAVGGYLALNLAPGQVTGFVLIMGAGATLFFLYYPCVYATIQDVVPADLRGTAMALYFLAMYLLGGSFGPVIVGRISDYFARQASGSSAPIITEAGRAAGLHSAMYVLILGCILVSVTLFGAAGTVARDMGESPLWRSTSPGVPAPAKAQD